MGKYVQWITHKGKRILFVNGARLSESEYMAAMEEMKQVLLKEREGALVVVDSTGTKMTTLAVNKAKEASAATKAEGLPQMPSVVVGLTGLQRAVAQLLRRDLYFAETVEEGKEDKKHR